MTTCSRPFSQRECVARDVSSRSAIVVTPAASCQSNAPALLTHGVHPTSPTTSAVAMGSTPLVIGLLRTASCAPCVSSRRRGEDRRPDRDDAAAAGRECQCRVGDAPRRALADELLVASGHPAGDEPRLWSVVGGHGLDYAVPAGGGGALVLLGGPGAGG